MNIMPVNNQSDRPDKHWSQFSVNAIWVEVSYWQQSKANVSVQTYLDWHIRKNSPPDTQKSITTFGLEIWKFNHLYIFHSSPF